MIIDFRRERFDKIVSLSQILSQETSIKGTLIFTVPAELFLLFPQ